MQSKQEHRMKGLMHKLGTAAFAAALTVTVASAQAASIEGEVRKIDEGAGKITLKHGAAKSLGMDEPMTMVYRVKDPAMLKQVKVGDKVKFDAENADDGYTVTKIQKTK
jgi:Cu(I)/Ag(I) efflux system periplasmic protein CusF